METSVTASPVAGEAAQEVTGQVKWFDLTKGYGFIKPAGGLRTAKDAMNWQVLMKEELGREWLEPDLFRIGASSLLGDIERQLEHFVTGRYAALNRHAMA